MIVAHRKALEKIRDLVADVLELRLFYNACVCRLEDQADEAERWIGEFYLALKRGGAEQERMFTEFVLELGANERYGIYGAFAGLKEGLVRRTLIEWCEQEVPEPRPFFLYGVHFGSMEHLRRALAIDPTDQAARCAMADMFLWDVEFIVRDMPESLFEPSEKNLKTLEEHGQLIQGITDLEERESHQSWIVFARELVQNYIDWARSGHPDLAKWGKENNKNVSYWK